MGIAGTTTRVKPRIVRIITSKGRLHMLKDFTYLRGRPELELKNKS